MTALQSSLVRLIKAQGPLSIAAYMAECLGNVRHGYYMKQDPFGRGGDFTTAPEISQLFGEILGLWLGQSWLDMGSPERIHFIELGPGRGTLMADILRSIKVIPGMMDALDIHLVEMSPVLRALQKKKLSEHNVRWHHHLNDIFKDSEGAAILLVANEFFDALPVRQYQKTTDGWHERLVGLDAREMLSPGLAPAVDAHLIYEADEGAILEICPAGEAVMAQIAQYISEYNGAALVIDYGHDGQNCGDSLQAVKAHQYVDIFCDPGDCDLTAHVNFGKLQEICQARDLSASLTPQGAFLKSLGIDVRADRLMAQATSPARRDILSALHRLTHSDEMGQLFKVMSLRT